MDASSPVSPMMRLKNNETLQRGDSILTAKSAV